MCSTHMEDKQTTCMIMDNELVKTFVGGKEANPTYVVMQVVTRLSHNEN